MLTDNKEITTPEYWDKIYTGKNDNAKVDASNLTRPANAFDRFTWVAKHAEGPNVIGIASGHSHIEKRIKAANPSWIVIASDQTPAAMKVAKYTPYEIINAYFIPYPDKSFQTVICAQAMEYMDDQERFIKEAKRVGDKLLLTVPKGNMKLWSQLRIYDEENIQALLTQYGNIEVFEVIGDLMLIKIKF